jgi:hypothetical protein
MTEPPSTTLFSLIESTLTIIDHLAARVTASATTGLACGAAFATYKGYPVPKTSLSAAASCALISTACFGMERFAYGVLCRGNVLMREFNKADDGENSTEATMSTSPNIIYGSHALGGLLGGGIVGYLYQGNPFRGAIVLMPLMLGLSFVELYLDEYREHRIRQLKGAE